MEKLMSLRELCEKVGVSRRTIQTYESEDLMHAVAKNKYGYLLYDQSMLERAYKIRFLHKLGFRVKEIKSIIGLPKTELKEAVSAKIIQVERDIAQMQLLVERANEFIENIDNGGEV